MNGSLIPYMSPEWWVLVRRVKGWWRGGIYPDFSSVLWNNVRRKINEVYCSISGVALTQLLNFDLDVARGQWFLADLSFEGLETLKPIWRNNKSFLYPFGVVASLREAVKKEMSGFFPRSGSIRRIPRITFLFVIPSLPSLFENFH